MSEDTYKSIPLECIIPQIFPNISLYAKGSGNNFVLYKPSDRPFTDSDQQRLERMGAKHLFINSTDSHEVSYYLEGNLGAFLANEAISQQAKNLILYQTSMDFVSEMLDAPHTVSDNLTRCKNLVSNLTRQITSSKVLLEAMNEVAGNSLYILSHSVKVAAVTMLVHEKLFNISHDEMIDVGIGGIFHDLGMTFLSSEILSKPEALSNIEYNIVMTHSEQGYKFLHKTGAFSEVSLSIVRHHHERWDGSGYPCKLKGDNISRSAQVAGLCDIYCALVSDRPYRKASSHAETLSIMENESGRSFNKDLFEEFKAVLSQPAS